MTYKKKLIEVALPLEDINREAARENYIYKGNPSAIHKWWAQRPLAACRAVLFASLVDDPSECLADLMADKTKRKVAESELRKRKKLWDDATALFEKAQAAGISAPEPGTEPNLEAVIVETERERLFDIIRDLVRWENSNSENVLKAVRAEIGRSCGGNPPPVYDPFCGGGSIPLEAQRLGLEAHASDLNPVPVLITKALIEIPQKFGGKPPVHPGAKELTRYEGTDGLAEDIRYFGRWMQGEAKKRVGHLYPDVKLPKEYGGDEAPVLAWLWARTVVSPNPAAKGAHVPLVRSFWLSTRPGRKVWVEPVVDAARMKYEFKVRTGKEEKEPERGTVGRSGARCILTGSPIPLEYVREQGRAGKLGMRLLAVVASTPKARVYCNPDPVQSDAASPVVPDDLLDTYMPEQALGFRVQAYGMVRHRDLFTPRQLLSLSVLADLVNDTRKHIATMPGVSDEYAKAVATYLAFAVDKTVEYNCSLVPWYAKEDRPKGLFARHAIPMVWDFAEVNLLGDIGGTFEASVRVVSEALAGCPRQSKPGHVSQCDATQIDPKRPCVFSSDPPYYDNIGYADLSDFFYVWLRRSLTSIHPSLLGTVLTPKASELIATPFRFGGDRRQAQRFFEDGLRKAFDCMCKSAADGFPVTIYYAFKQSEAEAEEDSDSSSSDTQSLDVVSTGWETMLEGLISAGFLIDGTWPIRTERGSRSIGLGTNALASSIVLVCRPRPSGAGMATRRDFLASLKRELPEALRNLQKGNIAPVDLAQAAIGPGMAVFSRYAKVRETDGTRMDVRTALSLINESLDEVLAEQEGEFDSDTRWALAWFDQNGFNDGAYGVAETLCTAKNTSVAGMVEAGILSAKGGKVRLLRRDELPADWDPNQDTRLTIWESTHQLIRALDAGEEKAANLLRKLGSHAEAARDLSYRLYSICERRKWAQDAMGYNALVQSWSDVKRVSDEQKPPQPVQQEFL
jgi:putative DNA methylase